jgi:hypothetical protein
MQGYLGLGFPASPGNMVPADAIIATIDDKTAATSVRCCINIPHAHVLHLLCPTLLACG